MQQFDEGLVEEVAVAIVKKVHPARFSGGVDYWNDWMTEDTRDRFRSEASTAVAAVLAWQERKLRESLLPGRWGWWVGGGEVPMRFEPFETPVQLTGSAGSNPGT